MLRRLRRATEDAYVAVLGGLQADRLNNAVLNMALRARGYGHFGEVAETGELEFISRLTGQPVDLCVDVGANRGEYSQALLRNTQATVIAFEPHPETYRDLATLAASHASRLFTVNQGVGDIEGQFELHWGVNSQLASFSTEVASISYVGACNVNRSLVPVTTLDGFFRGEGKRFADREMTLLKIDTEGFEYEVLKGATETLKLRRPKFVQVEFNHHQLFRGHTLYSISRLLEGYSVYQILPRTRGMRRVIPDDPLVNFFGYANFVFVRADVRW